MPVLVFLLVGAPYLLAHYVVNPHWRFNYIPPPLGGDRALEGHWTDAPLVAVQRVKFAGPWRAFGWIEAADDHVTSVLPKASGTVSQVYAKVGEAVAEGAPLFGIRAEPAPEKSADARAARQEIVVPAPIAGQVMRLDVAIGQDIKIVKGRAPPSVASIADLSVVWITASMDEGAARSMHPDEPLEIRAFTLPDRVFAGRLSTLSPVDSGTTQATARIRVDNPDGGLKPNMLATITASRLDDGETLAAPESALLFENGGTRVFVGRTEQNRDNLSVKLAARAVRLGRIEGGLVEALDGLAAGEKVEASDALFIDRAAKGY
jgi:multidrug efflux pump subunit AcrA (membrane-fusion protein)